ncbi:MAG: ATP-binding protein [Deltaproteobacteria bacterium]|jgi:hypothetical protein|nr:ATP-binding protein [Deltaproteobacteria bacterium]
MVSQKPQQMLPLGGMTFREIRERNFLYADKTEYIHMMVGKYKSCFLTRPRRFGKTLLLDTIQELFRGEREHFKGLWIETDSDYAFEKHPVLRFSMGRYNELSTKDDLIECVKFDLMSAATEQDVTISANNSGQMLGELLKGVSKKHGTGVVVLIDEYDAPVSRHIADRKLAYDNRDVLHDFYAALKDSYMYVRFALVTGITRFAMTSQDSGLNDFKDISLMSDFAGICGFTIPEFNKLFKNRFAETLRRLKAIGDIGQDAKQNDLKAKILEWYDGYSWLGEHRVLNPYTILNFFDKKMLRAYWPFSGQPSHLSALVREKPLDYIQPILDSYQTKGIVQVDLGRLEAVPVLFHSGYLTIDSRTRKEVTVQGITFEDEAFTFRTPNREVDLNYKTFCFEQIFCRSDAYLSDFAKKIPNALQNKDSEETVSLLHDLLAGITYDQHEPSKSRYHSIIHAAFLVAGLEVLSEATGSDGRSYMTVFLKDMIRVVIELKYLKSDKTKAKGNEGGEAQEFAAALDDAEKQIKVNDYARPHRAAGCKVICLALAICGRNRVAARLFELE